MHLPWQYPLYVCLPVFLELQNNLQQKVLKKKKASDESSPAEEDKTKPDNPNLSDIENKGEASNEDNKDSGDKKKDKKKK